MYDVKIVSELKREFLVGLFLIGALSHYSKEEVQKHKEINYILIALQKRHFSLKNGTTDVKLWANESYALEQIRKAPKKRIQFEARYRKAKIAEVDTHNYWITHTKISDSAWKRASDFFDENNAITVNQLVMALLRKETSVVKYYKFNPKKLEKFANTGSSGHIFASSRVATKLLAVLDEEIAHYYYNLQNK